jgi:hypothetical protein
VNDVAFAVSFMGINDPTPTVTNHRAAITPRPTGSTELVSDDLSDQTKVVENFETAARRRRD